jgi:hypothetical protein
MRPEVLQRCFSGKSGVWLKKRPLHVKSFKCDNKANASIHVATTIADEDFKKCGIAQSHCSSLIGWDEILGRPVYNYSSCLEGSEGNLLHNVTGDASPKELESADDKDSPTSSVDQIRNERSKKRKVFGGDRQRRPLTELVTTGDPCRDDESKLPQSDRQHTCVQSSTTTVVRTNWKEDERKVDNISGLAFPGQVEFSDEHFFTRTAERDFDENLFEFGNIESAKRIQAPRSRKRIIRNAYTPESSSTLCTDQTSLHKSLDTARAFFERLTKHRLILDTNQTPKQLSKRPCCRTRRARRLSSPSFSEEFRCYVDACLASGVQPLGKQDYAMNRGEYFRAKELYDGFLDE